MPAGTGGLRIVSEHGNNSKQADTLMLLEDKSSFALSEFRALKGYYLHLYSACFSPHSPSTYPRAADPVHGYVSFFLNFPILVVQGAKTPVRAGTSVPAHGLTILASR